MPKKRTLLRRGVKLPTEFQMQVDGMYYGVKLGEFDYEREYQPVELADLRNSHPLPKLPVLKLCALSGEQQGDLRGQIRAKWPNGTTPSSGKKTQKKERHWSQRGKNSRRR